jgi:hypothetical protein
MNIHEAQRDINMLRAVAAGLSRKRDAIYVLLSQIYQVAHKWVESRQAKELRDAVIILEGLRVDPRAKRNLFRFLIELSCPTLNKKLRSRYANALKYAISKKCPPSEFTKFIKARGGIEICANRHVAERNSSIEANNSGATNSRTSERGE